jgi:arylsulfatase A-like enzyme
VVITSDHGEAFNEHGFIHHENALYRELIHVPLIFWAPGYISPGLRIARPVSTTALAPTLLALVGAPPQASFQLVPLSELWSNPAQVSGGQDPISELARIERAPASFPSSRGPLLSLTNSEWHLILGPDGIELYACCDNRT